MKKLLLIAFFSLMTVSLYAQDAKEVRMTCKENVDGTLNCTEKREVQMTCTKSANGALSCSEQRNYASTPARLEQAQPKDTTEKDNILWYVGGAVVVVVGFLMLSSSSSGSRFTPC